MLFAQENGNGGRELDSKLFSRSWLLAESGSSKDSDEETGKVHGKREKRKHRISR
jgi:hypothetical protein